MTTLAEEREAQKCWKLRRPRANSAYDKLIDLEFEAPERNRARSTQALANMLGFAAGNVPYYRGLFRRVNGNPRDADPRGALSALPILSKLDVQDHREELRAERLPPGDRLARWTKSSGTTGRPTQVLHSQHSSGMFRLLKQREYRWFRLDPQRTLAAIRLGRSLPPGASGGELESGETGRLRTWPYMNDFSTGPYFGLSTVTPIEERIEWLRRMRPQYLLAYAQTLEHLAFAAGASRPAESLKGLLSVSEQLTPGMRACVERSFGVPVHENYGLNEVGIVAGRCEAGRYHVHSEHCLVEILDDTGRACAAGEVGRIIVTSLTNFAMPLIRYDTGDLAEAIAQNCSCGRVLPLFGGIEGRYGRVAHLPAGTMTIVMALRDAIEEMPVELINDLREFQIHQFRDQRMELRLVTRAPLAEAFFACINSCWATATKQNGSELSVRTVNAISRSPGGKFQVFTSDFMPTQ